MSVSIRSVTRLETRPWAAATAFLKAALGWPVRVLAARRAFGQLAGLSDHELKDIGLLRQDLRDATALKSGEDPTFFLAHRVRGRRRR